MKFAKSIGIIYCLTIMTAVVDKISSNNDTNDTQLLQKFLMENLTYDNLNNLELIDKDHQYIHHHFFYGGHIPPGFGDNNDIQPSHLKPIFTAEEKKMDLQNVEKQINSCPSSQIYVNFCQTCSKNENCSLDEICCMTIDGKCCVYDDKISAEDNLNNVISYGHTDIGNQIHANDCHDVPENIHICKQCQNDQDCSFTDKCCHGYERSCCSRRNDIAPNEEKINIAMLTAESLFHNSLNSSYDTSQILGKQVSNITKFIKCPDLNITTKECKQCQNDHDCFNKQICCMVDDGFCCTDTNDKKLFEKEEQRNQEFAKMRPMCPVLIAPISLCKHCILDQDCEPSQICCNMFEKKCCFYHAIKQNVTKIENETFCPLESAHHKLCKSCSFHKNCDSNQVCCNTTDGKCCFYKTDHHSRNLKKTFYLEKIKEKIEEHKIKKEKKKEKKNKDADKKHLEKISCPVLKKPLDICHDCKSIDDCYSSSICCNTFGKQCCLAPVEEQIDESTIGELPQLLICPEIQVTVPHCKTCEFDSDCIGEKCCQTLDNKCCVYGIDNRTVLFVGREMNKPERKDKRTQNQEEKEKQDNLAINNFQHIDKVILAPSVLIRVNVTKVTEEKYIETIVCPKIKSPLRKCHKCESNIDCDSGDMCCSAFDQKCCIAPTEELTKEPIGSFTPATPTLTCPSFKISDSNCKACESDDDCVGQKCCETLNHNCCIYNYENGPIMIMQEEEEIYNTTTIDVANISCPHIKVHLNDSTSCDSDKECFGGSLCCKTLNQQCCIAPTTTFSTIKSIPSPNITCPSTGMLIQECKSCSSSRDCKGYKCCKTLDRKCCTHSVNESYVVVIKDKKDETAKIDFAIEKVSCPKIKQEINSCKKCKLDEHCDGGLICCTVSGDQCCLTPNFTQEDVLPLAIPYSTCPMLNIFPQNCKQCLVDSDCNGHKCCESLDGKCCFHSINNESIVFLHKNLNFTHVHKDENLIVEKVTCPVGDKVANKCNGCKSSSDCNIGSICCKTVDKKCCLNPSVTIEVQKNPLKPALFDCPIIKISPQHCKPCMSNNDCNGNNCCLMYSKKCCLLSSDNTTTMVLISSKSELANATFTKQFLTALKSKKTCPILKRPPLKCKLCESSLNCSVLQECCNAMGRKCCVLAKSRDDEAHKNKTDLHDDQCATASQSLRICNNCDSDKNCSIDEKCCDANNKKCCFKVAQTVVTNPHCPNLTTSIEGCKLCYRDEHCGLKQICCNVIDKNCCFFNKKPKKQNSNQLSSELIPVVSGFRTHRSECPISTALIPHCRHCTYDKDCESEYICCETFDKHCCFNSNNFSRTHSENDEKSSFIPALPLECPIVEDTVTQCRTCETDNNCNKGQKCCVTGTKKCCFVNFPLLELDGNDETPENTTQFECPNIFEATEVCQSCESDEECNMDEQCCKVGVEKCCVKFIFEKMNEPPISNTKMISMIDLHECPAIYVTFSKCRTCYNNSDCSGKLKCCETKDSQCCAGLTPDVDDGVDYSKSSGNVCPVIKKPIANCKKCKSDEDCKLNYKCCDLMGAKCCMVSTYTSGTSSKSNCSKEYVRVPECKVCDGNFTCVTQKNCCLNMNLGEDVMGRSMISGFPSVETAPVSSGMVMVSNSYCPTHVRKIDRCTACHVDSDCDEFVMCCTIGRKKCCINDATIIETTEEEKKSRKNAMLLLTTVSATTPATTTTTTTTPTTTTTTTIAPTTTTTTPTTTTTTPTTTTTTPTTTTTAPTTTTTTPTTTTTTPTTTTTTPTTTTTTPTTTTTTPTTTTTTPTTTFTIPTTTTTTPTTTTTTPTTTTTTPTTTTTTPTTTTTTPTTTTTTPTTTTTTPTTTTTTPTTTTTTPTTTTTTPTTTTTTPTTTTTLTTTTTTPTTTTILTTITTPATTTLVATTSSTTIEQESQYCPVVELPINSCAECKTNSECKENTVCCAVSNRKCCLSQTVIVEVFSMNIFDSTACPDISMKAISCRTCSINCTNNDCCNENEQICCLEKSKIHIRNFTNLSDSNIKYSLLLSSTQCPSYPVPISECSFCLSDANCKIGQKCCNTSTDQCCISEGTLIEPLNNSIIIIGNNFTCPKTQLTVKNCKSCNADNNCFEDERCCKTVNEMCCTNSTTFLSKIPEKRDGCPATKIEDKWCINCMQDSPDCRFGDICCYNFGKYCCAKRENNLSGESGRIDKNQNIDEGEGGYFIKAQLVKF